MMFVSLITLSIFGGALAQVPSLGSCPEVETVPDFDVSKFVGRWYEAQKFFAIFEVAGKCITADYGPGQGGLVTVKNQQVTPLGNSSIEGTARIPNATEPGKLKVRLNVGFLHPESDYWVLGTDYEGYAVVYSCVQLPLVNFQFAWILTRERNPPNSVIEKARDIATRNHLDTSRFLETDQKNC